MAQQNLVAISIPEADLKKARDALETAISLIRRHLIDLTPQQRQELVRLGDRSAAFADKALEYAEQYPHLAPTYMDVPAMREDKRALEALGGLLKTLTPFYDALVDTQTATGSDYYQGALMFYASAQYGAKTGIPSAGSVSDDLATRFPSRTAKKKS